MAELIVHNPPTARLKSSGYIGTPTGEIPITENGTYNVTSFASAKVNVDAKPLTAMGINGQGWFLSNDSSKNENLILGEDSYGKYLRKVVV